MLTISPVYWFPLLETHSTLSPILYRLEALTLMKFFIFSFLWFLSSSSILHYRFLGVNPLNGFFWIKTRCTGSTFCSIGRKETLLSLPHFHHRRSKQRRPLLQRSLSTCPECPVLRLLRCGLPSLQESHRRNRRLGRYRLCCSFFFPFLSLSFFRCPIICFSSAIRQPCLDFFFGLCRKSFVFNGLRLIFFLDFSSGHLGFLDFWPRVATRLRFRVGIRMCSVYECAVCTNVQFGEGWGFYNVTMIVTRHSNNATASINNRHLLN